MAGKKPILTLRKPPEAVAFSSELADSFVSGERPDVQTPERPEVQVLEGLGVQVSEPSNAQTLKRSAQVLERRDGRSLRRTTIYFPVPLARKLAVYCARHDLEMSEVVSEAVRALLSPQPAADS
jgi:hypothetical protein